MVLVENLKTEPYSFSQVWDLKYKIYMDRRAGILLHISSLPSEFGVGDLGPKAYEFVDFLAMAGQSLWQVLPINPTGLEFGNSPYFSSSLFAGNTLFVSPELLYKDGLLSKEELESIKVKPTERVDYPYAYRIKDWVLEKAFERFRDWDALDGFIQEERDWLLPYCNFSVFKKRNKRPWNEWEEEKVSEDEIMKVAFGQYVFFKQWRELKVYANSKGILLVGDLPIYPAYDSVDVWQNRHFFKLDKEGRPLFVAGVPPDQFSPIGQIWGNPVYNWERLMEENFDWWVKRVRHNLKLFDLLRLDHFRGFVAYYQVPYGEKTAVNGFWVSAPAQEFLSKLREEFPQMPFIAEDLGTITEDVQKIRESFDIPGMKVLCFAFLSDDSPHMPHNHTLNSVVTTTTHDTMPLRGWFVKELDESSKRRHLECLGMEELKEEEVSPRLIRLAYMSVSKYCIVPMQDILNLGEESRMNIPGSKEGNWEWRCPKLPEHYFAEFLHQMCYIYSRRRSFL